MTSALVRITQVTTRTATRPDRRPLLDLDAFARECGVHPELVGRMVRLGLLEATTGPDGRLVLTRAQVARLGRIKRLHARACLNYAAIGLVLDLLDRIAELEAELAMTSRPPQHRPTGGRSWIRTD
ncbi:chaperone modulator CbpM [Actinopolymorpha sp. B17G11]|uniref:chaperone modulator CbpM n=1 Tax=unclassified Actinopolymorpha TaxID=2627063 RepID=UPI0032D9253E